MHNEVPLRHNEVPLRHNPIPKYKEGDVLIHKELNHEKRIILFAYYENTEIYYSIKRVGNVAYPPMPISETALDLYYCTSKTRKP